MRKRLHGRSFGWMFLASLLVAGMASCAREAEDPGGREAEHADTDSTELEHETSQAVSAATVRPGTKLDRQQLAQLLGDRVAAGAGQACPTLGEVCAPRALAPTTECGYTSVCDARATQTGVWVDFICQASGGNQICTGVVQDPTVVTVDCNRVTNGNACGTASCGAPFCLAYSSACSESTTQVRNCTSAGVCSNEMCTGQTTTQQTLGSCLRDTDGLGCSAGCQPTQVAVCQAGGCRCRCPATAICLPGG